MARLEPQRRLIVNADDFGLSESANLAIIQAHRDGILTSASLMVNEPGFKQAVTLAKENPKLGVGLHLTLVCGHSALAQDQIPSLVDPSERFSESAVASGMHYFFSGAAKAQLRREIAAQFEKFRATGLVLDHVNGHLNIHLHPAIFSILMENAAQWRIRHLRLTNDPLGINAAIAGGQWLYRGSHWLIYKLLAARSVKALQAQGIRHTDRVFGLLQNARVDEQFIVDLLSRLPAGDSELYSHPSLDEFRHELDALLSPRVRAIVENSGIRLIRYQDL